MTFEESWRWYGPNDPVSLIEIKQTGARGVVTSLHHLAVGEIWTLEAIKERLSLIEQSNQTHPHPLRWNVVESLPVHEQIKFAGPDRDAFIENYILSMKNLSRCGIRTICYNFMPVLDWLRSDLGYKLLDGSRALWYDEADVAVFDMFILKRKGAEHSYEDAIVQEAQWRIESYNADQLEKLKSTLLLALPGESENFTLERLRSGLQNYVDINKNGLRNNLVYFLEAIIPVAEELDMKMAIHPDDPPWSVFGLPRVVSNDQDLQYLFEKVPSLSNGLTFCSGSLGPGKDNDLTGILNRWHQRIHFTHLRSIRRVSGTVFHEDHHLEGDADMYSLVRLFVEKNMETAAGPLPMRPDHGHLLAREKEQQFYPGYSYLGRLRGLAEIRGIEHGIRKSLTN